MSCSFNLPSLQVRHGHTRTHACTPGLYHDEHVRFHDHTAVSMKEIAFGGQFQCPGQLYSRVRRNIQDGDSGWGIASFVFGSTVLPYRWSTMPIRWAATGRASAGICVRDHTLDRPGIHAQGQLPHKVRQRARGPAWGEGVLHFSPSAGQM